MKLPNLLYYSLLLLILAGPVNSSFANYDDCVEIDVKATVTNTTNGLTNGSISLTFKDDFKLYRIHLIKATGKDKLNVNAELIQNLEKGKYSIVITSKQTDSQLCPKFFELVVK